MLARYKGVCKRTHRCVIRPGDMVVSYNGGWAHVLCHSKRGVLMHTSTRPTVRCKAGWTVPDETRPEGYRRVQCSNEIPEGTGSMCAVCSDS